MKNERIINLITEADELLEKARAELGRSAEDVTAHLVCHNARQSLLNYLTSFLLHHDVEPIEPPTLAQTLDQCRSIDSRFEYLDITPINCRFEVDDRDYCLSVDKVDECFHIADQAKAMVLSHPPSY